jgi:hypothetical protein
MARLKPKHITELNCLHAQCKVALEFLYDHGHLAVGRAEWEAGIDKALAMQELRGMRMVLRDLQALAGTLSAKVRQDLDQALARATGVGLFNGASKDFINARAILERGQIRNATEYYLIRSRLDQIEGTGTAEEADLRNLLTAFEVRE